MNTNRINKTKVKKFWDFPPLSDGKQGRVITKHFTNLSLILNPNHYALLSYLIYQSAADNTVIYSQGLLIGFEKSVKAARKVYGEDNALYLSLPKLREHFEWLIENGLLLPTSAGKIFLINPCLTFSKVYVKAEFYKGWVSDFQVATKEFPKYIEKITHGALAEMADDYINHVSENFKRRGKSFRKL